MKRHALIIGCSHYDDDDIADLKFAHEDAEKFATALKSYCGFDAREIDVLTSRPGGAGNATRNRIIKKLSPQRNNIVTDLLVIFFSGHGICVENHERLYLLPQDAVYSEIKDTAVSLELIQNVVQKWTPRCTLLVIDACRNVFRGGKSLDDRYANLVFDPSRLRLPCSAIFFSCAPSEHSYEVPALGSGLFTHAFTEALGEDGRCETLRQIESYLSQKVPLIAHEHDRPQQTPFTRIEPPQILDLSIISAERKRLLETSKAMMANTAVGRPQEPLETTSEPKSRATSSGASTTEKDKKGGGEEGRTDREKETNAVNSILLSAGASWIGELPNSPAKSILVEKFNRPPNSQRAEPAPDASPPNKVIQNGVIGKKDDDLTPLQKVLGIGFWIVVAFLVVSYIRRDKTTDAATPRVEKTTTQQSPQKPNTALYWLTPSGRKIARIEGLIQECLYIMLVPTSTITISELPDQLIDAGLYSRNRSAVSGEAAKFSVGSSYDPYDPKVLLQATDRESSVTPSEIMYGPFANKTDALALLGDIRQKGFQSYVVTYAFDGRWVTNTAQIKKYTKTEECMKQRKAKILFVR